MRVHLITFSEGSERYRDAGRRVISQARRIKEIDLSEHLTAKDLDIEYFKLFHNFPERYPTGYGLYSWKPYLVNKKLNDINTGDILIYIDAGCELNRFGSKKFSDYLNLLRDKPAIFFKLPYLQSEWSKDSDILCPKDMRNSMYQISATVFLMRKCDETLSLIDNWLRVCANNDGDLLKDPVTQQPSSYRSHRHDQSCLTICINEDDFYVLNDRETWDCDPRRLKAMPFLAFRNRTGRSKIYRLFKFPLNLYFFFEGYLEYISRNLFLKVNNYVKQTSSD
ncbi:hypothetical protein [Roseobacter sp. HKCCD5988]|uniref:hypothetical protein n=1 Tax=Roseobacter sp. HKCCD5988 TaxID=3120338 RepID=UPI0030EEA292